ncbi:MAG: hypothetical protein LCH81_02920 [Bacteroidetes bacterium]|nr:hypothetical protein [Bacteroidota bacterium]
MNVPRRGLFIARRIVSTASGKAERQNGRKSNKLHGLNTYFPDSFHDILTAL